MTIRDLAYALPRIALALAIATLVALAAGCSGPDAVPEIDASTSGVDAAPVPDTLPQPDAGPCGAIGITCCPGDTCPDDAPGSYCELESGTCVTCGRLGRDCCPGEVCFDTVHAMCDVSNVCVSRADAGTP